MEILECAGLELEKEKSNSPEDLFNRSSVSFKEGNEEKGYMLCICGFLMSLCES